MISTGSAHSTGNTQTSMQMLAMLASQQQQECKNSVINHKIVPLSLGNVLVFENAAFALGILLLLVPRENILRCFLVINAPLII